MGVISAAVSSSSRGGSQSQDDADEETWARLGLAPLMATLLLPIIIGVIVLLKCVFNSCCVRRTTTKEEMYGLEGRMTMLPNADSSFVTPSVSNHHPPQEQSCSSLSPASSLLGTTSPQSLNKLKTAKILINNNHPIVSSTGDYLLGTTDPIQPNLPIPNADSDPTDTLKRATTGKRQLPDLPQIPLEQLGHPRRSSSALSHDGTSELYATVGEVPNPSSRSGIVNPYAHLMNRQNSSNNSSVSKPSTPRGASGEDGETGGQIKSNIEPTPSSDSETYASSNHPYAKLKRNPNEHPYARVRNSSLANDEETDTDNYDMPQPYAETRGRQLGGSVSNNQPGSNQPSASSSSSANVVDGPVPPRRIGRQWRRGSHPQGQQNNDAASQHFSGDSQDSRGYTSISVREPLSNIRSQVSSTRNADSHYATVSDDSEEMYAAIDDSSESNYMQITDGTSRPSWLDAANVASPIPERREANSPLPPVPAVPPPSETPGAPGIAAPTSPLLTSQPEIIPPLYAQVTKKSKKGKAPVTPTASNASTSSQIQDTEPDIMIPDPDIIIRPVPPVASTGSTHLSHHHHHHHHRSKSRTLMDNSNPLEAGISEPRRWSKADISYSEFEVVREGLVPLDLKPSNMLPTSNERPEISISPRESITSKKSLTEEVDEDNYNVIPDKPGGVKIPRSSKSSIGGSKSKPRREMLDADNYQEIEPISNTYQEIGCGLESSDHYQEIGRGSTLTNGDMDDDGGSGLYQEIRKKDDYDEEDEEDQLYEKVKPSPSNSKLAVPGRQTLDRKHGYEKLKHKGKVASPQGKSNTSDDDENEEDEETKPDDDLMYERVKYPPYERLKESRSDLAVDAVADDDEENDFYEHIGYSRVKPKHKSKQPIEHTEEEIDLASDLVDVNQLYAVVDKTKKKKNISSTSNINCSSNNNNNNSIIEDNLSAFSGDHGSTGRDDTTVNISSGRREETTGELRVKPEISVNAVSDLNFIDDSIDIEYI